MAEASIVNIYVFRFDSGMSNLKPVFQNASNTLL